MSRDLSVLTPELRAGVDAALASCRALGIEMRPYETLRDPWTQARYWRQSRSIETIEATIGDLERQGASFLAHVLRSVGPQSGEHVTDALPGASWHQWGEAVDCFWVLNNEAEWSTRKAVALSDGRVKNGYHVYAEESAGQGLTSGGLWNDVKDWVHVQKRPKSVLEYYSWPQIDQEMRQRFGVAETTSGTIARAIPQPAARSGPVPDDFVQTRDGQFGCRGGLFRFIGFNVRGVVHYGARYPNDLTFIAKNTQPQHRAEQLRKAYDMGGRVVRVFLPHRNATPEQVGDQLEQLLEIIEDELPGDGVYILPALTDFYGASHVPFKVQGDESAGHYEPFGTLSPAFFGGKCSEYYLPFVEHIVGRFKDEKRVFAWEIANEAKVDNDPWLFINFNHLVARIIRSIDPNHMVTTGMISTAHACMYPGDERRRLLYGHEEYERRLIDFVTIHYPNQGYSTGRNDDDIDLAKSLNMPFVIEEQMIIRANKFQSRKEDYQQDMNVWFGRGAAGYMPWGFDALNIGDGDSEGGIGEPFADYNDLRATFYDYEAQLSGQ
jgi:peptidoglycan L-alanyl-D-glutamate endopeptidase CwlK